MEPTPAPPAPPRGPDNNYRSEYRQLLVMRFLTILVMVALGVTMSQPYSRPQYPMAQRLFYLASAVGYFSIVYLRLKPALSSKKSLELSPLQSQARNVLFNTMALSLVFFGLMETFGWYDSLVGFVVDHLPLTNRDLLESLGFIVTASVTGVIGNFAYYLIGLVVNRPARSGAVEPSQLTDRPTIG